MKFTKMVIENFRQFYGINEIKFADDDYENVTLIYGANGSGKTTILNAMTWVFYDKFSSDFENPNKLICERKWYEAENGDEILSKVEIEFEHAGRNYTAAKTIRLKKSDSHDLRSAKESNLNVHYIDEEGEFHKSQNPKDLLDRLLPERLHNFFFFNGERIDNLAKDSAYSEIQDAIKTVLGLEVVDRSIKHLSNKVKKHFYDKWSEQGTQELKEERKKLQELDDERQKKKNSFETMQKNVVALKEQRNSLSNRLSQLEQTKDIEENIQELELQSENFQSELKKVKNDLANICSAGGYLAFTPNVVNKAATIVEDAYKKRQIPSRIKRKFVEELLENQMCICGRPLIEHEEAFSAVGKWKESAGLDDVEEAALKTRDAIELFQNDREKFFSNLKNTQARRENVRKNKEKVDQNLSEKKKELKDILSSLGTESSSESERENYKDLKDKFESIEEQIQKTNRNIGSVENELEILNNNYNELESNIRKLETKSDKEKLAKRRVQVLDESINVFNSLYTMRWREVRKELQGRINNIYQNISFKPYTPVLTENYHLKLTKEIGEIQENVAKSTGENQILSLSFIGSLVDYARHLYNNSCASRNFSFLSFKGGIYPLVIDSPFGTLDTEYGKSIAEVIPKLSPQVILMVSKSQGLDVVKEKLNTKIGKAYSISYSTNKENYTNEDINWKDRSYPYIQKSSNNYEYANIMEMDNG